MTNAAHRNWFLQNRLLVLAIAIVVAAAVSVALTLSSGSSTDSTSTTTTTTTTTQAGEACTKGGSCGYENVTAADAVEIIANQTTGPGSLKSCVPTNGETAALKGTDSSEWDCVNATSGAIATYTINADGSVDY